MNHEAHSELFNFSTLFTTYPKVDSWRAFTPVGHLTFCNLFKPVTRRSGKKEYYATILLDKRMLKKSDDWKTIGQAVQHYGDGRPLRYVYVRDTKWASNLPNAPLLPNYDREHTVILSCTSRVNYPPIVVDQNSRPITHFDSRIIHKGRRARFLIGVRFVKAIPNVTAGYCTFNLYQVQIFLNEHTSSDLTTRTLRLP